MTIEEEFDSIKPDKTKQIPLRLDAIYASKASCLKMTSIDSYWGFTSFCVQKKKDSIKCRTTLHTPAITDSLRFKQKYFLHEYSLIDTDL